MKEGRKIGRAVKNALVEVHPASQRNSKAGRMNGRPAESPKKKTNCEREEIHARLGECGGELSDRVKKTQWNRTPKKRNSKEASRESEYENHIVEKICGEGGWKIGPGQREWKYVPDGENGKWKEGRKEEVDLASSRIIASDQQQGVARIAWRANCPTEILGSAKMEGRLERWVYVSWEERSASARIFVEWSGTGGELRE
ncbi:hypothetical protein C8R44DRAFT_739816 [Mycena epipterygia]|nr:hypothetical protein C8R44DRAFT_739816 [Mycena epipterygia]